MKFEITAAAELELDEAVRYYNQQRTGLGDDFVGEVRRAVEQVLARPHAWAMLDDLLV